MNILPAELAVAWDRFAGIGWRPEQVEWVEQPTQGERNRVYILSHAGHVVVIRLPREKTKRPDWHAREMHNLAAAAASGVAPKPILADPTDGLLVLPYIQGVHPMPGAVSAGAALRIARCLRSLHRETAPFYQGASILSRVRRRMARVAAEASEARRHAAGLPTIARAIEPVVTMLERTAPPPVPCHSDLVLGNIIDDGDRVYFIDWETSTHGDPHHDIANVCLRMHLQAAARAALLDTYFNDGPERTMDRARARVILWEPTCALDKALTYWRHGNRSGYIDHRVAGWTQCCSKLLAAPGMRAATLFLDTADL